MHRLDRNHATVTPIDQGNSQSGINVTTQIRREIIADDQMSINAKTLKITTVNRTVSLRGPVGTDEEKNLIAKIANRIAQSRNVDNQLEAVAAAAK